MPVFEYRCNKGHITEVTLQFGDKPLPKVWCLVCNMETAERKWSIFSFRVKP